MRLEDKSSRAMAWSTLPRFYMPGFIAWPYLKLCDGFYMLSLDWLSHLFQTAFVALSVDAAGSLCSMCLRVAVVRFTKPT